jgi:hypothetical protein
MNSGSPDSRCYAPARLLAPIPDGPGSRPGVSKDEGSAGQPPHPPKLIAILLLRLVLPAALAAGRIRSKVSEGVWAGRVNTLAIWRR